MSEARAWFMLHSPQESQTRFSPLNWPHSRAALLLLIALAAAVPLGLGQNVRVVQGRVVGSSDQPLENAIVYLENEKSLEIKTYITQPDGNYRFGQLGSDVDYQVWAKYQNHKSKTRSISSFDSKKQFNFDLKVDTGK